MALRSIIALVLGFTFAIAFGGLYTILGPSSTHNNLIIGLLLLIPIWIAACALAFVDSSAQRACATLLVVNVVSYALLWALPPLAA